MNKKIVAREVMAKTVAYTQYLHASNETHPETIWERYRIPYILCHRRLDAKTGKPIESSVAYYRSEIDRAVAEGRMGIPRASSRKKSESELEPEPELFDEPEEPVVPDDPTARADYYRALYEASLRKG